MRYLSGAAGVGLVLLLAMAVVGCGQEIKKENEQLKAQVAGLQKENVDLKGQVTNLKADADALKKQVEEMNKQKQEAEEKLKEAEAKLTAKPGAKPPLRPKR
jgi:septal ring factor EnvC (AmiA/AmiB activator)